MKMDWWRWFMFGVICVLAGITVYAVFTTLWAVPILVVFLLLASVLMAGDAL
jgi:hypothetical protein